MIRASFLVITYFVINGYNNLSTINKDLPNYSINQVRKCIKIKITFQNWGAIFTKHSNLGTVYMNKDIHLAQKLRTGLNWFMGRIGRATCTAEYTLFLSRPARKE